MKVSHDVAVVGLGAMGSAAACQLARRGRKVIAFDLSTPPHTLGSTHGQSRVIRESYFEHPLYVPLVQKSYECWQRLQSDTGKPLLNRTGAVLIGAAGGTLVSGSRLSADRYGLDYEMLTAAEVRRRYPVLRPGNDTVAVYEPRAGILFPEQCVQAHLGLASRSGADIHFDEPIVEWKPRHGAVQVKSERAAYTASQLLLAPGAWMRQFVPDLDLPLTVERQVLHWFAPETRASAFALGALPVYAWEYEEEALFYGFPDLGDGVKVALHHQGVVTDAESIDRTVAPAEVEAMRMLLSSFMPDLGGTLLRSEVCMYTNTPDEHFIIDFHPELPQVLVVSPCSGHGFKFAAVIGEIAADLLIEGKTDSDLTPFRLDRFSKKE
ncbi:MAG: N-methyl-L-tryptophan oxidase [Candidatus Krumholzibacteriia bacterium]